MGVACALCRLLKHWVRATDAKSRSPGDDGVMSSPAGLSVTAGGRGKAQRPITTEGRLGRYPFKKEVINEGW